MTRLARCLSIALVFAAPTIFAACGPATVQLRPANTCDSSPDGLNLCAEQCDSNEARSCYRIGWFHETGQEVSQSMRVAMENYKKACDLDFAVACRALGQIYWSGEDEVKRNPRTAIQYYRKACKLGIPEACPTRAMVASSEGRRIKPGDDVAVETAAGYAPDAPEGPDSPDAPTVNTPDAPAAEVPDTPAIDVSGPSIP